MKFERFIAIRYLFAREKNKFISFVSLFSICGIFIGVAALIIVLSVMNGFENEIRTQILDMTAHLSIYSHSKANISNWRELKEKLASFDFIKDSSPFIQEKIAISTRDYNDGIMLRGVDTETELKVNNIGEKMVAGSFFGEEYTGLPPIVLGSSIASRLGVITGDTVFVFSLKNSSQLLGFVSPKVKKFVVGGLFETGMYEFDASMGFIPLEVAQEFFDYGRTVTGLEVKLHNFYKADRYDDQLDKALGFPYYSVTWMEMNKNLFSWMTLEKWAMFIILSLIIGVAVFNIISNLFMVVMEKKVDIGVLKSMGAKAASIRRIFILQGLIVGIIGTVLGLVFGIGVAWAQETYSIITLPPDVYSISSLPVRIQLLDVVMIVLASASLSFLSTLYPAYKASKLAPIDCIRYG